MSWKQDLKDIISSPQELFEILQLDKSFLPAAEQVTKLFPLRVPREFVGRMQKNDLNDPLLKQVLPLGAEAVEVEGYVSDPLQEKNNNPLSGLLHKYHGRVLLTLTGACGIHCRYCFRRDFPYADNNPGKKGWEQVFTYIKNDTSIQEVILSGGDPLVATDEYLADFIEQISTISHIKTLRIHSRMPIVIPSRITTDLVKLLTATTLRIVLVVHTNHANEINPVVKENWQKIQNQGITLLNQSVLLKGINDNAKDLIVLSETLFSLQILPYYLHLLDKVKGTSHFYVNEVKARDLVEEMRAKLPGYLVPKLVQEIPGRSAKIPV